MFYRNLSDILVSKTSLMTSAWKDLFLLGVIQWALPVTDMLGTGARDEVGEGEEREALADVIHR